MCFLHYDVVCPGFLRRFLVLQHTLNFPQPTLVWVFRIFSKIHFGTMVRCVSSRLYLFVQIGFIFISLKCQVFQPYLTECWDQYFAINLNCVGRIKKLMFFVKCVCAVNPLDLVLDQWILILLFSNAKTLRAGGFVQLGPRLFLVAWPLLPPPLPYYCIQYISWGFRPMSVMLSSIEFFWHYPDRLVIV